MPRYCSSTTVSIALRAGRFDGRLHGHDVVLRVCIDSGGVVDVRLLRRVLETVASRYDHVFIDEALGGDALIEDLAARVLIEVLEEAGRLKVGVGDASVKAIIPDGEIILSKREAEARRV